MESPPAVLSSPAGRLSEEAMDLVCSFVRAEEEDDRVMAKTLRALALTSRRWMPSAVRALWHDPSRALAERKKALNVPNLFFRRPHQTVHVKALVRLPELFQAYCREEDPDTLVESENWFYGILRCCTNLTTIGVSYNMPFEDSTNFKPLNRIRHLRLEPEQDASMPSYEYAELFKKLEEGGLQAIQELTISCFTCIVGDFTEKALLYRLPVTRLNLVGFHSCEGHLRQLLSTPNFPSLRHLDVEAHGDLLSCLDFFPPALQKFSFRPLEKDVSPDQIFSCGPFHPSMTLMPDLSHHPSLTSFTFENAILHLADLALIAAAWPALELVDLTDSIWRPLDWVAPSYAHAFDALSSFLQNLPHLHFLSLGYLPLFSRPLGPSFTSFFTLVDGRGLDLRYNFPLLPDDDELEADEGARDDSGFFDDETESEVDWQWITYQDGRILYGGYEQSLLEAFAADLQPSSSPSSPFRLADRQVYLDEPPVVPKLEPNFQVDADEVEEEKEEPDEPWRRWETDEDIAEADRRWQAFEPETE
ncbi:hypothetical protein JCM6882_009587 [Rhodosporidiobolus microsporus]